MDSDTFQLDSLLDSSMTSYVVEQAGIRWLWGILGRIRQALEYLYVVYYSISANNKAIAKGLVIVIVV